MNGTEWATLLMDKQETRRFRDDIEKLAERKVKLQILKAGDFLISGERGDALIERKSIFDMAGSIGSNQLFKELKQMSDETKDFPNIRKFLLVEGSPLELMQRDIRWSIQSLLAGMMSVPLSWGMNLIWLDDKRLTLPSIFTIAEYLGKSKEPPQIYGQRPKRKNKSIREKQRFLLEGIVGIGGKTADKILGAYGSPQSLFRALEDDNEIMPNLNRAQRAELKEVIFGNYNEGGKK
jgi:ERCC4-type nuclease